jgi:hypothetical protein
MNRSKQTCCRIAIAMLLASVGRLQAAEDPAAGKYRLRYQFQVGQAVYFTVHNETQRSFQFKAALAEMQEGSDSLKHYRVLSMSPEGHAVLELMIDRTRMWIKQDDERVVYDSTEAGKAPAAFAGVNGTIGKPWLHVTVTARGETLVAALPGGTAVPGADEKGAHSSSDFLSRVLPLLPAEEEVAVGATWKEPFTIEVPETDTLMKQARLQRRYTLTKVEGDVATIAFKTERLTPDLTPKQEARIAQILYEGTFRLDHRQGMLLGRELQLERSVPNFDGPATKMTLAVKQQDAIAPEGAATPAPARPAAPVKTASAAALRQGN